MNTLTEVFTILRKRNRKQYALLAGCLFFSALLITCYCLMMRSPTVLNVLPVGGDSRKQVMMVFVLAVIGCGAFSLYAAGLFFREKSRETGVFLALGASRETLGRQLKRELGIIAGSACVLGMILGTPLAWLVWSIFRQTLVDTAEMRLSFDYCAYGIALVFSVFVILLLFVMLSRFLRHTNVIDVIVEAHRSEPVRGVPKRYGPLGIVLLLGGALLGYLTPGFFVKILHWYAPEWLTGLFYIPAFIGLYMILLHTVVNGWRQGQSRYKHIVTTSMMQFQGRQTVRNMLVVTVLLAGAYFSAFYIPLLATPARKGFAERTEDYSYFYRADQDIPGEAEIRQIAAEENIEIKDFVQQPSAVLGVDGMEQVERTGKMGTTYTREYRSLLVSSRFFSESAWNALTGDTLNLAPGTVTTVYTADGTPDIADNDITLVTNPVTGKTLSVACTETTLRNALLCNCRVLDDADYASITAGLSDEWREMQVFFNVKKDSYAFAKRLFNEIVDHSDDSVALCGGWDPIVRQRRIDAGKPYAFDEENAAEYGVPVIRYDERDSSTFRLNWMYMPQFRVLDQEDFLTNMAVFLLLFVFISILCFAAVAVILYTRSLTIALTNAWIYDDLRRLGAPDRYLRRVAREQISRVFLAPVITGTLLILAFVMMILIFNSGVSISAAELASMKNCLLIVAMISAAIYWFYRLTLSAVCKKLKV
ncbi:MAG: FtsX-like permease family protein [Oscillospiraceae bacterium]|jgi:putative ABC transport system permease protein